MVWGLAAPFGTTCALDGEVRVTLGLQPQAHIWGTKWPPEADRMADDPHLSQEVHRGLKKHAARATGSEVRSVFPKLRKLADEDAHLSSTIRISVQSQAEIRWPNPLLPLSNNGRCTAMTD